MSRGTERYTFRLPPKLMREVEATRLLRNQNTREEPWTLSDLVRIALAEKVKKMNRSRKRPILVTDDQIRQLVQNNLWEENDQEQNHA
jgi:hypothetical protein